jgi:hypothetical protein
MQTYRDCKGRCVVRLLVARALGSIARVYVGFLSKGKKEAI